MYVFVGGQVHDCEESDAISIILEIVVLLRDDDLAAFELCQFVSVFVGI